MCLSHVLRVVSASGAVGFALTPSLTSWKRWPLPSMPTTASDLSASSEVVLSSPRSGGGRRRSEIRAIFFVSTIGALVAGGTTAEAGGFAVREQSAYGQGSSFAGMAAPGDSISSMFWNPAAVTIATGMTVEGNVTAIFPESELDVDPSRSTLAAFGITSSGGDVGETGIVPATYFAMPITEEFYIGMSVTAPYGLATTSDEPWVEVDGELIGPLPMTFDVVPDALSVIVP